MGNSKMAIRLAVIGLLALLATLVVGIIQSNLFMIVFGGLLLLVSSWLTLVFTSKRIRK